MRPEGWFSDKDAQLYVELCQGVPAGGTVVEVGSYKGRSASYVAPVLQRNGAKLICIDSFVGVRPPATPDFAARAALRQELEANLLPWPVEVEQCESTCASQRFDNNSVDIVYIDAMHDQHSVRLDIEHWWPKIKPGGWIAGHDYDPYHTGVVAAVNQRFGKPQRVTGTSWAFRKMPLYIGIETCAHCNRKCGFCPTNNTVFPPKEFMSEADFLGLIQQLKDWGYCGGLSLYGHNEALLDKRLEALTAVVAHNLPGCSQSLSTNGDKLTPERFLGLFQAGLKALLINAYDQKTFLNLRAAVPAWCQSEGLKYKEVTGGPMHPMQEGVVLFDASGVGASTPGMSTRAGNVSGSLPIIQPVMANCLRPTTHMHIKWNGNCILCCNDWKEEVVLGNAFEPGGIRKAYGSSLNYYYQKRLGGNYRAGLRLCNDCDWQ